MRHLAMKPHVRTFFYGSYINPAVLGEVDLEPDEFVVARLPGFDLEIRPLANLVQSDQHVVYGVLAEATHDELSRLYTHAEEVLGGTYLPYPVLTYTSENHVVPALCYISPGLSGKPATLDYVRRILNPAREFGFPNWYLERIESFAP